MQEFKIIGLMSGTSLDGLDIVYVSLTKKVGFGWEHSLIFCKTVPYDAIMQDKLRDSITLDLVNHELLSIEFAKFSANAINVFISENNISRNQIDAISSHGHTTHHRPDLGFTKQIGCGQTISALTGIKTIADFRTKDVVYGGQGAPLVPIGDELLFDQSIDSFLNIGGICNISFKKDGNRLAYDVCMGNLPLNHVANRLGLAFDESGQIAKSGKLIPKLLNQLSNLAYYQQKRPKSLGLEWIISEIYPLLSIEYNPADLLKTLVTHIAQQLSKECTNLKVKKIMCTGGGALNTFLIEELKSISKLEVVIPSKETILFKEAMIFAFLGVLRLQNEINCLNQVTGARISVSGGIIFEP